MYFAEECFYILTDQGQTRLTNKAIFYQWLFYQVKIVYSEILLCSLIFFFVFVSVLFLCIFSGFFWSLKKINNS